MNQKKLTNDKLIKDISSKKNSDSETNSNHLNNEFSYRNNIKITNQIEAAYASTLNHENNFNNCVNKKTFFNYQNFNSISNELNRNTSEENLIDKNEEKINISSHKIENIEIKSFEKENHLYKKSKILINPLELEKIKQLNNHNLKTEMILINQNNHLNLTVNEKRDLKFNENQEEEFYQKFVNTNSLKTLNNSSNGCFDLRQNLEKNENNVKNKNLSRYSQTSRFAQDKTNFGDILVNLEREKLEFEKNFESNTDLESLRKTNNTKSNNCSTKELKKVEIATFTDNTKFKESEYLCFNENTYNPNKSEKSYNINNFNSNINPQNKTFMNIQNLPSPIPCDNYNLINYDVLSFIEKDENLNNKELGIECNNNNLNNNKIKLNSMEIKNSNFCIESDSDLVNLTTNNEFQLEYSSKTHIIDKKNSGKLNNYLNKVNFNLNNSKPKVENYGCYSSRDQQSSYNISSKRETEFKNPNFISNENVDLEYKNFIEKNYSSYSDKRLILSQDDLKNNQSYIINKNPQKIKPHHESKKSSYCRLGTILEVIENEKEKDKVFFNTHSSQNFDSENLNCEISKNINYEKDSNNCLNFYNINLGKQISCENTNEEFNKNLCQSMINDKKSMGKYISLNIREIIKDKEKIEKINMRSRCNTEEFELESPRGIYDNQNISKKICKSESVKGGLIMNEKKYINYITDRDKTPM